MTEPHPMLSQIPDAYLRRTGGPEDVPARRRLMTWTARVGYRPSLAELEEERARRGMRNGPHEPRPRRKKRTDQPHHTESDNP